MDDPRAYEHQLSKGWLQLRWSCSCLGVLARVEEETRRALIMGLAPPPTRRLELAEFLRNRRETTTPDAVGLSANGNRRTPGLHAVAMSRSSQGSGWSWYTWLEQGREITPSSSVLDALARVRPRSGRTRSPSSIWPAWHCRSRASRIHWRRRPSSAMLSSGLSPPRPT